MELRNGRKYFPELEHHFSYSFKIKNRKSPKTQINNDIIDRHQNCRQKTNISGGHSSSLTLRLRRPKVECAGTGSLSMEVAKLQNKDRYMSKREQIGSLKLSDTMKKKSESILPAEMEVQKFFTMEKQSQKNTITMTSRNTDRGFKAFTCEDIVEPYSNGNGCCNKQEKRSSSIRTSTPILSTTNKRRIHYQQQSTSFTRNGFKNGASKMSKQLPSQLNSQNDYLDSLEDHIFHDTSFKKICYEESKTFSGNVNNHQNELDDSFSFLYKLNGSYLSQVNDSSDAEFENPSIYMNHYRRSLFRQRRRDWYLNRTNQSLKIKTIHERKITQYLLIFKVFLLSILNKIFKTYYIWQRKFPSDKFQKEKILHAEKNFIKRQRYDLMEPFIRICSWISKSISIVLVYLLKAGQKTFANSFLFLAVLMDTFSSSCNHYGRSIINKLVTICFTIKTYVKNRLKLLPFTFMEKEVVCESVEKTEDDSDDSALLLTPYCCVSVILVMGIIPILLFVLAIFSQVSLSIVPDPSQLAVSTSRTVFLGTSGNSIPAWHFLPPSAEHFSLVSSFDDKSPVTLFLQDDGDLKSDMKVNIFKTLVSLGYHVIVPVNVLNDEEVTIAWSWVKEQAKSSSAYLWGEHLDSNTLTGYAKDFCTQLLPPDGVIIETEIKKPQYSYSARRSECVCDKLMHHRLDYLKICDLRTIPSRANDVRINS